MEYRLFVEDIEQNHWVAWVLDLPGCFSSARTQEEAVALAPMRISAYFTWLKRHGHKFQPRGGGIEVTVEETFRSYVSDGMYVVNAFFEDDERPLDQEEVDLGLAILEYTRLDLLDSIEYLTPETLYRTFPGEVHGSIAGLLEHIAWAEWWYFDRIEKAPSRDEMPADPLGKLQTVRAHSRQQFPALVGDDRVRMAKGEKWSARKVLRRTIWHERDHTQHIEKLKTFI